MSTPLPGQRAGQRPMRAAVASQRAIGRSVVASGGMSESLILNIRGRWMQQVIDSTTGQERLTPYELQTTEEE